MARNEEEFKKEPLNETPGDVKAKVLVQTMADTAEEFKAAALILIPPDTLVETAVDTNREIQLTAMAATQPRRLDQKLKQTAAKTFSAS